MTAKQHGRHQQLIRLLQANKLTLLHALIFINPFNPEFTIVIIIHYKPQIAVAILDL